MADSEQMIISVAHAMYLIDKSRNPTWGGPYSWDQLEQYKRDDYLAMAEVAILIIAGIAETNLAEQRVT